MQLCLYVFEQEDLSISHIKVMVNVVPMYQRREYMAYEY